MWNRITVSAEYYRKVPECAKESAKNIRCLPFLSLERQLTSDGLEDTSHVVRQKENAVFQLNFAVVQHNGSVDVLAVDSFEFLQ